MPQIDSFLARLIESRAERATFHSDAPLQVQHPNGNADGSVTSGEQVAAFLQEILPPELQSQWEVQGQANFTYASPSGQFQINARRTDDRIHLEMVPGNVLPPANPVVPIANDSGTGPKAVLPEQLRGFNFGAFLLSWIWAIGNRSWVGLLGLVPVLGFLMRFYLGFKGNELAWKNRQWFSYEQFKKTQTTWMIGGIVLAGVGILMMPIFGAVFFPVFARARENARRAACQANLAMIAAAVKQYQMDNNGYYPPQTTTEEWQTALKKYATKDESYRCPSAHSSEESYAFNTELAGQNERGMSALNELPMVFDSRERHLDGANIGFADGHIKWFKSQDIKKVTGGE